jgi:hypothetical protein
MNLKEEQRLFVDLDGNFAQNNLFQELLLKRLFQKPLSTVWVFLNGGGVLALKHLVFDSHKFSIDQVIVNQGVLKLISQKKSGYKIYLVTASPQAYAYCILKTLTVFDYAFGSDQKLNLKTQAKLDLFKFLSCSASIEYVGDSKVDQIILMNV